MKKVLLLSVVASTFIYAGGDIAPVEPVQPTAAPAACNFWGTIATRYDAVKDSNSDNKWSSAKDSSETTAIAMGVEKELGYGFGFGAELGAFYNLDGKFNKVGESAELSQAYITYKNGNTAIKAGRQALPQNLSPWAWSDRTAGVLDRAYNGIVVVNTDLPDTVLVGAWIASFTDTTGSTKIDTANGTAKGLFAIAAEYKGIANTTIDATAYYVPKFLNTNKKAYSIWASVQTKASNFDLGLQAAYAKVKGSRGTYAVSAYAGTTYQNLDAKLTLGYINNGAAPLVLGTTSGLWSEMGDDAGLNFGGDRNGGKQKIAKLDLGYKLPYGKLVSTVAYDKSTGGNFSKKIGASVGYEFNVKGVDALIEYKYVKTTGGANAGKVQRIRVQGVYKF